MSFVYNMADTWNVIGTTFNSILMNASNGAAGAPVGAAASRLVNLQKNGSQVFGVDVDGKTYIGTGITVFAGAYLQARAAANENLYMSGHLNLATGVVIAAINDAASANVPIELRGSQFLMSGGRVGINANVAPGYLTVNTSVGAGFDSMIAMRSGTGITFGWDFQLDDAVTGDLQLNRVIGGAQNVVIYFTRATGGVGLGTTSDPGAGMMYTNSANFLLRSKATLTNGAGVGGGTLLNAPAAGNPTKWLPYDDNGTTRYIPAW